MTRRLAFRIMILLATALAAAACQWRELDYDYINTAKITVIFDWSESGLKTRADRAAVLPGDPINGRTAAFYPVDGGEPVIKYSHSDTLTVNLAEGEYRAVFFNETFEDFDNIRFEGIRSFEDLEALAKEDVVATTRAGGTIVRDPDILAVDMMIPFVVTEDMVRYTRAIETKKNKGLDSKTTKALEDEMTVIVRPRSVVYKVTVEVVVTGWENIASSGAYINGFAGGYDFSEGHPNGTSVTHKVNFTYGGDSSVVEGASVLTATFQCFGYRDGTGNPLSGYSIDFRAMLVNGEIFQISRNLDYLVTEGVEDGHLVIYINIGDGSGSGSGGGGGDPDDPESGNKPIVIPDVHPVGGEGMWTVDVGDWDEVVIPVEWPEE